MLKINNLTGFGAGGGSVVKTKEFLEADGTSSGATTYNHTNIDFGTGRGPNTHVLVFVGAASSSNRQVSSVTIAGVSATKVVDSGLSRRTPCAFYIAKTSATGNQTISPTYSGSCARAVYAVWSLELDDATVHDTDTESGNPGSMSISTLADGLAFAAGVCSDGDSSPNISTSGWTERFTGGENSPGVPYGGGDAATDGSTETPSITDLPDSKRYSLACSF